MSKQIINFFGAQLEEKELENKNLKDRIYILEVSKITEQSCPTNEKLQEVEQPIMCKEKDIENLENVTSNRRCKKPRYLKSSTSDICHDQMSFSNHEGEQCHESIELPSDSDHDQLLQKQNAILQMKLKEALELNSKLRNENTLLNMQNKKAMELAVQAKRSRINTFSNPTSSSIPSRKTSQPSVKTALTNKENTEPDFLSKEYYNSSLALADKSTHKNQNKIPHNVSINKNQAQSKI